MARELKYTVLVDGEVLPAGTSSDHKLAKKVTNPAAWSDDESSSTSEETSAPAKATSRPRKATKKAAEKPADNGGAPAPAPATSERPADDADTETWAAYARSLGQDVADDADRDAIVAQLDDAGLLDSK